MPHIIKARGGTRPAFDVLRDVGLSVDRMDYQRKERSEPHAHDFVEMNYIVAGTAQHFIEDDEFAERPGSLGVIHFETEHEIVTGSQEIDVINVYLDPHVMPLPSLPDELTPWLGELLPLHAGLRHRQNRVRHLQFADPAPVESLLTAIRSEQQDQRPGYKAAMFSYFRLFLIECTRLLQSAQGVHGRQKVAGEWEGLEMLRQHLDQSFAEQHSLDDLADEIGWSRSYLCRQFKAYTGLSLFEYIHQSRLREAMLRLRTTDAPIASIAEKCGFGDLGFFNRKFKAMAGMSPRQYRKQLQ